MTTTTLTPAPVQTAENSPAPPEWVDWQVAHQIPGRLRIRIPRLNWDDEFARRLQRSLLRTTAISESRINAAACSLIVSYPAEMLSATAILDYLQAAIPAAGREREPEEADRGNRGTWPTLGLPAL
ncbi:MAG: HMA2 domain-containing protein, partial [Microcystis sp.]|uniref:HMA2 domain-containing protein n=1 Tax=Microcystis sp. TaxID=1127 RepID=UPI003918F87A